MSMGVDHDAESAFRRVLAHERQRVGEIRIDHAGHGDQEVMGEVDGGTHWVGGL